LTRDSGKTWNKKKSILKNQMKKVIKGCVEGSILNFGGDFVLSNGPDFV